MQRALFATVDEVGRVSAAEGIDCHYHKGGTISLVRSEAQMVRARQRENECREWGFGEEDYQLLSAGEAREIARADGVLGALFSPHCAAIHPARLARGLAEVVEKRGVRIYEQTPVASIHPQAAATPRGVARGRYVLRATEGYTPNLAGQHRTLAPIYSLMIATEPLSQGVLDEVGLANRETFADLRNLIIYGQRTADGRIAFGGRGAPYHFAISSQRFHSTGQAAWVGRVATSARAWPPRTSRGEPWLTWSRTQTQILSACRGSTTNGRTGSANLCAGLASTAY
jgi:glycine/D-amino acid oxidase-like deaminating enzyme